MNLEQVSGREYVAQVKARLTDNERWAEVVTPELIGRTEWALTSLLDSLDQQMTRAASEPTTDRAWLRAVRTLSNLAQRRLDELPSIAEEHLKALPPRQASPTRPVRPARAAAPPSSARETRAWRGFAADMAQMVMDLDPDSLAGVQTPYGDLEVIEWLAAREAKRLSRAAARAERSAERGW